MEQKRTLWIIAAVGIFLLVVLGGALILYSPTAHSAHTIEGASPVTKKSVNGWIANPGQPETEKQTALQTPAQTTGVPVPPQFQLETEPAPESVQQTQQGISQSGTVTKVHDLTVIADNTTIYGTAKDGNSYTAQTTGSTPVNFSNTTTIDLNMLGNAQAASSPVTRQTEPVKSAPAKKAVAKASTPAVKKSAVAKVKIAAKKTGPVETRFWIQVAAYSSRKSADNARSILDDNKITADVFTYKDGKGKVFYRVRIGPYITRSEAEYWRTRIGKINEFTDEESFITTTTIAD